jgi:hypothetical protein
MHLYVDISGHGFGHLAQTAPVLNALRERLPQLRLTLRCALPRDRLSRRVRGEFTHIATASDFGLIMKSALDVDLPATLAAYQEWHKDWEALVEREARRLTELAPDGVLSNVSYLALAAAHRAGIPAIGLGSLHWAAICAAYFRDEPAFRPIHDQMLAAYGSADAFLRLTPGMAMTDLPRVIDVGPVAEARRTQRAALPAGRLVLVAMGGIGLRLPARWPRLAGVHWLLPRAAGLVRNDVTSIEETGFPVSDLIASVDVVLTKSGYGTFVEAAASGTPVLYVSRPDWPEEAALSQWLTQVSLGRALPRAAFEEGAFAEPLLELLEAPRPEPVVPSGVAEAADWLATYLAH